tara:strand:- start:1858 stop:2322 length:465 start_codon:yes stop_codon:yes gene_type:complete
MFQAPVLTTGHRLVGVAALLGFCFVLTHIVTVIVTCVVDGFNWGINAWVLDIAGFLAAFYFAIQCGLSSSRRSADFRKVNTWIFVWAAITLSARILDILMLFGIVKWSEIYITPVGPTLWSNVVSEIVFGMTFTVTALVGSMMLLFNPQDVDTA